MQVQYSEDYKHAYFDEYTFTRDEKTGYFLSTAPIKGRDRRLRLHDYVWEFYNHRQIPWGKGYAIHHKDEDKLNNEIDNLELITQGEHSRIHMVERYERHPEKIIDALEKARPYAAEWHRSDAGREWHMKHYEDTKDKLYKKEDFVCLNCGKPFTAVKAKSNKFCSNNCKSAYRRKLGVDNVERKCERCGDTFITNKYSARKYCRECSFKIKGRRYGNDFMNIAQTAFV